MVSAAVPLVIALDDPAAVRALVGGKGASLARLARAGFAVPPGFCVTSRAYFDFVAHAGLAAQLQGAMSVVDVCDPATYGAASREIAGLFAGRPWPAATAAAIAGAYAGLGEEAPVAVRSSATTEDLPGL